MNRVQALVDRRNQRRWFSDIEKKELKKLGRPTPHITITQDTKYKGAAVRRKVDCLRWYKEKSWICGCEVKQAFFCYVCLLFKSKKRCLGWASTGVTDLRHLTSKIASHESGVAHIANATSYALLGPVGISKNSNTSCRMSVNRQNAIVDQNRYTLSKVIECIKLCGASNLAQTENLLDKGLFLGLVDLVADLAHAQNGTFLKDLLKTSSFQNQLLECMLEVCRCEIYSEISDASFLSIQVSEITDSSTSPQLAIILRYETSGNIVERFWGVFNPTDSTVGSFSEVILNQLNNIVLQNNSEKLIAQSYDGGALLQSPEGTVPSIIKERFKGAHLVHNYAQQLNDIVQQATYTIPAVRMFFTSLSAFSTFFAGSPKRIAALDDLVDRRLQTSPLNGWDFSNQVINTVSVYADELIATFQAIRKGSAFDGPTTRDATFLLDLLKKPSFRYWLKEFNKILPHFDGLSLLLQTHDVTSDQIESAVCLLRTTLMVKREIIEPAEGNEDDFDKDGPPPPKVQCIKLSRTLCKAAVKQVCDIISAQVEERYCFNGHLDAARLLCIDRFEEHRLDFPLGVLERTCSIYPCFEKAKLTSELRLLYETREFRAFSSLMELFRFFVDKKLDEVYTEVMTLIRIVVTTPMITTESERCFTTMQRAKMFIPLAKCDQRLNAIAMLGIEKCFMQEIPSFSTKVIDKFGMIESHRKDFLYS